MSERLSILFTAAASPVHISTRPSRSVSEELKKPPPEIVRNKTRRFLQRINPILHTAIGMGLPYLERDNRYTNAEVKIESIDVQLEHFSSHRQFLLVPTESSRARSRCKIVIPGCPYSDRDPSVELSFEPSVAISANNIMHLGKTAGTRNQAKECKCHR